MSEQATIDGHRVDVRPGDTILDAVRQLNIDLPTLCYVRGLPPEGGCRMCLVASDGGTSIVAACHTSLRPGMTVETDTPRLRALRRDILELTVADHPGVFAPNANGYELERWMAALDVPAPTATATANEPDATHPYLRFDDERCITCRRCLAVCESVQGQFVYGIEGRGAGTSLVFGADVPFNESPCVACGTCVDVCPTGAVFDRDRSRSAPTATGVTESICGYCGVGCRVAVATVDDRVVRIDGVATAAVNRGHLCVKGRYAHAYHHSPDRLTTPLRRKGDDWESIGWDEAIAWVAARLRDIATEHGPEALGVMTSSRSTNEAAYLLQKLFRSGLGTNNVDCCARVCHSSTALALQLVTGTGAASASYDDIERARCIVVAGANPTEAHPVVGARIKQAVLRGATLLVIDPRRIELAEYADLHLPLRPGSNVALFNALAKVLIEESLFDRSFVDRVTDGFDDLAALCERTSLSDAARHCGLDPQDIRKAARRLASDGPALFVTGLGLSETTQGTAAVMTICNLAMLTGSFAAPGVGMLPLRGQNNVQGNADMGGMPNQVTGYQPLNDEAVRSRLATNWGAVPPTTPGLTIPEMLDAAADRRIRGLWIQGEDVAQSDPNERHVRQALQRLDLLVVQELFMSETAQYAHLVLPAAGVLEQDGTFTNGERRIQLVRPAVPPPGKARPDWLVARDVAAALGHPWSYDGPDDVMAEIARVAPRLFGGVRYDRLEPDGLQWPCPATDHPGTATVHAEGFLSGRGHLAAIEFEPGPEIGLSDYPFLLITGRVLDHYNVGTMTRRTPSHDLLPCDELELNPTDARAYDVADGDDVVLTSRWGETTAPARLSQRLAQGTLFLSFHYPETHTNCLVGPHLDPQSKCPGYKVTAVRITKSPVTLAI